MLRSVPGSHDPHFCRPGGRIGQYRDAERLLVLEIDPLGRTAVPTPEDVLVTGLLGEEYFGRVR